MEDKSLEALAASPDHTCVIKSVTEIAKPGNAFQLHMWFYLGMNLEADDKLKLNDLRQGVKRWKAASLVGIEFENWRKCIEVVF